jgi:hypothetical protein
MSPGVVVTSTRLHTLMDCEFHGYRAHISTLLNCTILLSMMPAQFGDRLVLN